MRGQRAWRGVIVHPARFLVAALLVATAALPACPSRDEGAQEPAPSPPTPAAGAEEASSLPPETSAPATPAPARDEEPNGSPEQAGALVPDVPRRGYVDAPKDPSVGDEDWFRLDVPAQPDTPQLYTVVLTSPDDLDVVLEWMPAPVEGKVSRTPVIRADVVEKAPGDEILGSLALPPGPAYFRVREAWYRSKPKTGSTKPYVLTVRSEPAGPGRDAEPNDTPEQASALEPGTRAEGHIGHFGDEDVWRLPLDADLRSGLLRVAVDGAKGLALDVTLAYEGSGKGAVSAFAGGEGQGAVFRRLAVPAGGAEALLIRVKAAKRGASTSAAYGLEVRPDAALDEPFELEPNDGRDLAFALPEDLQIKGFIDRTGDRDRFSFQVDDTASLGVGLLSPSSATLGLALVTPDGRIVRETSAFAAGEPVALRGWGVVPGRWQVEVRGTGGSHAPEEPYQLSIVFERGPGIETEPNDAPDQSGVGTLIPGGTASGWLQPAADLDVWKVGRLDGPDGRIVTFGVTPPPEAFVDVDLLDEAGARLTGRIDLRGPDETTFTHFLSPGRYTLVIRAHDPKNAHASDAPYQMRMLP